MLPKLSNGAVEVSFGFLFDKTFGNQRLNILNKLMALSPFLYERMPSLR